MLVTEVRKITDRRKKILLEDGTSFVLYNSEVRQFGIHENEELPDEMIRRIASKGGVIGLNQNPPFLYPDARASRMEDCIAHLKHLTDIGGIDCAALGSDFDGCRRSVRMCMKGPQEYPGLARALMDNGFSREETEKIFYKNMERVIREVMN